jgi:glycopeptide antibiotics resistance protein
MYGSVLVGGEFAFLPLLLVIPLIAWHGARNRASARAVLVRIVAATYTAAVIAVTFFPLPLPPYGDGAGVGDYRGLPYPWLTPVPFETIRSSLGLGLEWPAGRFLIGNILAFIPLGILVRLLRTRSTWRLALAMALTASLGLELLQLAMSLAMGFPYRVADVDDVILNVTGAMLGWVGAGFLVRALERR